MMPNGAGVISINSVKSNALAQLNQHAKQALSKPVADVKYLVEGPDYMCVPWQQFGHLQLRSTTISQAKIPVVDETPRVKRSQVSRFYERNQEI